MGNITLGIIPAINKNADNRVEPVSSKTIRLMGRLMVCPAMADIIVPKVIRVKSLDHTVSFFYFRNPLERIFMELIIASKYIIYPI